MFLNHHEDADPGSAFARSMLLPEPARERRAAQRAATVFTIGKMTMDAAERPCMVRNLSTGGMRVQMWAPPQVGSRILIEMRGLAPRAASVRWVDGRDAGLAFIERCDIAEIFEARLNESGQRARQPRFDLDHSVELRVGENCISARLVNISVGGARLLVAEPLTQGSYGVLRLNLGLAFDFIAGEVSWVDEGACGFRFACPIGSLALALALEAWEAQR